MLAKFIQEQRKKHKLTQEFLASALKISRPTYMQIEQSERELTITEAKELAAIFSISLEDFLASKPSQHKVTIERKKKAVSKSADH